MNKVLIISAPSGAGKSTLISALLKKFPQLEFSISATSRTARGAEEDGVNYYFLSTDEFKRRVDAGEFLEWEEVYNGSCYGTLKSEIERIWSAGNVVVFDVDVVGGTNIKKRFLSNSLSIFVQPPSIEALRSRLESRGTDDEIAIAKRIDKAEKELAYSPLFDKIVINDDLPTAQSEIENIVADFLSK